MSGLKLGTRSNKCPTRNSKFQVSIQVLPTHNQLGGYRRIGLRCVASERPVTSELRRQRGKTCEIDKAHLALSSVSASTNEAAASRDKFAARDCDLRRVRVEARICHPPLTVGRHESQRDLYCISFAVGDRGLDAALPANVPLEEEWRRRESTNF